MKKSVLVIFSKELPQKSDTWWGQFTAIVAPAMLLPALEVKGVATKALEEFLESGSVQQAAELARMLSLMRTADGRRVSRLLPYKGYELWWMHYDDLYYKFCLPFTEYSNLLNYLRRFEFVYLNTPPASPLFKYFLRAHGCRYEIAEHTRELSIGIIVQVLLSLPFLLVLMITRPPLMLWTSDQFDPPRDHDFRMRFIYEALRAKRIRFVEFLRSMEPTTVVLTHAWQRKRPVMYSSAISRLLVTVADALGPSTVPKSMHTDSESTFWWSVATHYVRHQRGDVWSIRVIAFFLRSIGSKAAIIDAGTSRNFHEVLACKISGIPTVGILHGVPSQYYPVYDFMPEFDGEKTISVDRYGLWSPWWKEYYQKNSRAYTKEQLYVSGPMRPLTTESQGKKETGGPLKVLFVSEQLAVPEEALPYLIALMEAKDLDLYIKFRSYRDGFEEWLTRQRPEILKQFKQSKILRGSMSEAITRCDVIVGSHTGGVLEALLQLKPPIFFKSKKWGDYFELGSMPSGQSCIVQSPSELLRAVREAERIPQAVLKELQERFFGDPYRNGSTWVVSEIEKVLGYTA